MDELLNTTCPGGRCEVKGFDGDHLIVEGLAAPTTRDLEDEHFAPGAFAAGLADYLRRPVLLFHHDPTRALGRVLEARETPEGLYVKAAVVKPPAGSPDETIFRQLQVGIPYGFSVGGRWDARNGRITAARISEISLTPQPVNTDARATVSAGASPPEIGSLAARLGAMEAQLATLRRPVAVEAAKAVKAVHNPLADDVERLQRGVERYRDAGDILRVRRLERQVDEATEAQRVAREPRRYATPAEVGITERRR